jgi:transcriptional regulator with XRE-family HTH domain
MFNGTALAELRQARGWTTQELAERLRACDSVTGTAAATVEAWERGSFGPPGVDIDALARVFAVPQLRFFAVPDSVPIPRQVIADLLEALLQGDSAWAHGLIHGALSMMGYAVSPRKGGTVEISTPRGPASEDRGDFVSYTCDDCGETIYDAQDHGRGCEFFCEKAGA